MEFLRKMLVFVSVIRLLNLLMIAVTILLTHYFLVQPFVDQTLLNYGMLTVLIFVFVLTAASGYVINDIMDHRADAINKPLKTFIPNVISLKKAWNFYFTLVFAAILTAIFYGVLTRGLLLPTICLVSIMILYLYSVHFKKTVLLGNIIVSILIAFAAGIVLMTEYPSLSKIEDKTVLILVRSTFLYIIVLSFLINMIREIIKDAEDYEGDKIYGCQTLAVAYGVNIALRWAIAIILVFLIFIAWWMFSIKIIMSFRILMYMLLFIILPMIFILQSLFVQSSKQEITRASSLLKWVMLAGLISVILISDNISQIN